MDETALGKNGKKIGLIGSHDRLSGIGRGGLCFGCALHSAFALILQNFHQERQRRAICLLVKPL